MEFEVELLDKACGTLTIDRDRFSFRYLDSYVTSNAPPISASMPLSETTYSDDPTFPFFENLLPEGQIRRLMAEKLKTADNNFSRLFESVGGDVAGAIRITPKSGNETTANTGSGKPQRLSKTELGEILERIKVSPFLVDQEEKPGMSLAGTQDKLPIMMRKGEIYLANGQPSTHIIKPPSERFNYLVENEYLCMRSAQKSGINVPPVKLLPFINKAGEEYNCLLIERYDRDIQTNITRRIHQEDICQVMSVPSSQKYAKDGGPDYADLFNSVSKYTVPPAIYQVELIRRIFFNLLVGNNDAHAKNFSLLYSDGRIELAPAYDIVATEIYEELDRHFAIPFGEATRKEELNETNLRIFEQKTHVNLRRQKDSLTDFIQRAHDSLNSEIQALKKTGFPDISNILRPLRTSVSRNKTILLKLLK